MQFAQDSGDESWQRLNPLLEEAMMRLGKHERDVLVLRFFKNRTIREVAEALNLQEAATQKRVNRATEKLRKHFVRLDVQVSATALLASIGANAVQAAPVALAKSVTAVAIAKGAGVSGSTLTLIKTTLKIMAYTKTKTLIVAGAVILLAAGTTTVLVRHPHQHLPEPQPVAFGQTEFPKASWHYAGYADPESAFLSCMWAVGNGDVKTLLAGLAPAMHGTLMGKPADEIITAKDHADFAMMTGYRILDQQVLSENEVMLETEAEGLNQTQQFFLQRINGEWKFAGKAK